MFGTLVYMTHRLGTKKIDAEIFRELWNLVLKENGENKMIRERERERERERVTNEQVLERIGGKKALLNNILRRKAN